MAQTKRAEVLMEPEEYGRLEEIARQRHTSVEELIRQAIQTQYLYTMENKTKGIDTILEMQLPIDLPEKWEEIEEEIMEAHLGRLP